jgi:CRP-like cAMP-binding protein
MPQPAHAPEDNRLLAALPIRERRLLLAGCQPVEFGYADVLCRPGKRLSHVFFPLAGSISVVAPAIAGASLDAALIGDEGMLGVSLVLGMKLAPHQGRVQHAGRAWRIETEAFLRALVSSRRLQHTLNRYLYVTLVQLAQTTVCARYHVLEERLARWLLMSRDRNHADDFPITHQRLADSLGVRRVGITQAANSLQQRTLIRYRRGHLRILDGHGLERVACGCYAVDTETYRRLMS